MRIFSFKKSASSISGRKTIIGGFTLVEMIVSLAIFAIVAVIAVGALVRILGSNRQAQSIQTSVNNLSFALESMSRELRTGRNYHCAAGDPILAGWSYNHAIPLTIFPSPSSCAGDNAGVLLAFDSAIQQPTGSNPPMCNLVYAYRIRLVSNTYVLEKAEQSTCASDITQANFYPIVSTSTVITAYQVIVSKPVANGYAKTFIRLLGYSGVRDIDRQYFDVETAVSSRMLDQ